MDLLSKKQEQSSFAADWEAKMKNFEADFVQKLRLKSLTEEVFYDDVILPTKIQGAFLSNEDSNSKLRFKIIDPDNKVLISYVGSKLVFDKEANNIGRYSIYIKNLTKNPLSLTFTYSSHRTRIVSKSDIDKPKKLLEDIKKTVDNLNLLLKFKSNSNNSRYKSKIKNKIL